MIQPSEIVTLFYGLVALGTLAWLARNLELPGLRWLIAGVSFIGLGYVFTVVEGFWWPDGFDVLEHSCYALAGVAFCIGMALLARSGHAPEEPTI